MKVSVRIFLSLACASVTLCAQTSATPVERAFDAAKKNPPALRAFLQRMPKGGDLHMHLTGAIYAESFLDAAAHGLVCVDTQKMVLVPAKASTRSLPPQPVCGEGLIRASDAVKNQTTYNALIDSLSMRGYVPTSGWTGHDQFFATFARFDAGAHGHAPRWIDEAATRAASQNEQYLEIMNTPDVPEVGAIAASIHYTGDVQATIAQIKPADLQKAVAGAKAKFDEHEAQRRELEHCDTPQATAACRVVVRYIYQILREQSPEKVFVGTLVSMELQKIDPLLVGVNFVQPEDDFMSMSQYSMQMKMVGGLYALYPSAHISLHAGELAFGMVPPDGLRFHIREAVEVAHAERIGHGVDVMYEDDAAGLLREMAEKHVMVEVNLTSNDVILGVKKSDHPLASYRAAHVPFALSTDDEGVSRIDLTNEYVRGAIEQNLSYRDLRDSARASLEHSFLAGESLWAASDNFTRMKASCMAAATAPAAACKTLLAGSERAMQQMELERRLRIFESEFATGAKR